MAAKTQLARRRFVWPVVLSLGALAAAPSTAAAEEVINTGFFFFDGQYIPAPYAIHEEAGALAINNCQITSLGQGFPDPRPGPGRWGDGQPPRTAAFPGPRPRGQGEEGNPGFGANRPMNPAWRDNGRPPPERRGPPLRWLVHQLQANGLVFVWEGKPAITLGQDRSVAFFRTLTSHGADQEALEDTLRALPQQQSAEEWRTWLTSYNMPESLSARAEPILEKAEQLEADNAAAVAAQRRLDTWSYPLSVVGMVLAALTLGHLLKTPPKPADPTDTVRQSEMCRAAAINAGLILLLSSLDLAWTILRSQAGLMTEMNPIGNKLIEHPETLAAFKATATLVSCGLLLALRRHARAQWAAWWLCLICTILTFRWLVMHSIVI